MSKFPITKYGFKKLEEELKSKYRERLKISEDISRAREFGDLSENAEYKAAQEKQFLHEIKIRNLEDKLARADIIDIKKLSGNSVKFGASVKLVDNDTEQEVIYRIVGEYEADISKNLISIASPIARALITKKIGDIIEVVTPKGTKSYELLDIKYIDFDV